jgi:cytochrome c oxidase subunit II
MVRTPRRLRVLRVLGVLAGVGVLLLLAGCAANAPQDVLKPEGAIARKQDNLFKPIFYLAVVPVFVLVQGLIIASVVRHRHRPGRPDPVQVHGNTKLEIGWTAAPALILLFAAVPTINGIFDIAREPKGDVLKVQVYGHLWWWEYIYPKQDGIAQEFSTANELHIPTGRPVRLSLESIEPGLPPQANGKPAQGVIHSYWIPKLAGKQDVVPGRVNHLTVEADKPGKYLGQCAEYCNLSHANMRLAAVAQEPDDFAAWAAAQQKPAAKPTSGIAAEGFKVFSGKGGCLACHTMLGVEGAVARVGPNLTHLKARDRFGGYVFDNTPQNLRKWVDNPSAMKPMRPNKGTGMPDQNLSPEELDQVVAYLETLK